MAKDWTGNYNSVFKTLGSSHHSDSERQREDYYATEPKAADFCYKKFRNSITSGNVLVERNT